MSSGMSYCSGVDTVRDLVSRSAGVFMRNLPADNVTDADTLMSCQLDHIYQGMVVRPFREKSAWHENKKITPATKTYGVKNSTSRF